MYFNKKKFLNNNAKCDILCIIDFHFKFYKKKGILNQFKFSLKNAKVLKKNNLKKKLNFKFC